MRIISLMKNITSSVETYCDLWKQIHYDTYALALRTLGNHCPVACENGMMYRRQIYDPIYNAIGEYGREYNVHIYINPHCLRLQYIYSIRDHRGDVGWANAVWQQHYGNL
jgi:hypothetical protein